MEEEKLMRPTRLHSKSARSPLVCPFHLSSCRWFETNKDFIEPERMKPMYHGALPLLLELD